ncbi:MAG: hypothetical protein JXJ04_04370 [Spirochaetales bacterium]|nr:hypothetical protein [Spirochaetales bacterium]
MILFFISPVIWATRESVIDNDEWALYTKALELLVDKNEKEALVIFKEFLEKYPESSLKPKVEEYINILENTLDHSSIVLFYITQLLSTTYVAITIPQIFNEDVETNGIVLGLSGIAGVGVGLGSAWLMTKDNNMSLGQNLWIENMMLVTLTNYNLLRLAITDDFLYNDPLYLSGQLALIEGSRIGTYFLVKDNLPSPGRASFYLWSYVWAHYYTWLTATGLFKSEDLQLNTTLGLIIPDLLSIGSYFLWDRLHWSFERNGLISISGLGGILVGSCINLILSSFKEVPDQSVIAGVMIASACAGTGLGIFFTSHMKEDTEIASIPEKKTPAINFQAHFNPSPDGTEFGLKILYSY